MPDARDLEAKRGQTHEDHYSIEHTEQLDAARSRNAREHEVHELHRNEA